MGIRRRRRKLTTLISRLDQQVKSVTLRPVSFLTSDQVNAAVEAGEAVEVPESVVSASAPFQWRRVEDAYIYPKALTGLSEDRVEIYLASDLSIEVGGRLHVSGLHWASSTAMDATGDNFTVKEVDTPPWTDRGYRHDPATDQLPTVTITNTYSYKPDTVAPSTWASKRRFQTRRLVDTFSITGNTVTLTMNDEHKFKADDIIFVDIFNEDSRAYGTDGLFRIDSVTSTEIVYTLDAGVATPTGTVTPDDPVYVFPVAREYAQVGSTWADSANNKIYYWDGIRWVDYSTVSNPAQDGDPPAAPTGFNLTGTAKVYGPTYIAYSEIVATWTAPTLTEDGLALTDLLGYRFKYRTSPTDSWKSLPDILDPNITSYTFDQSYAFVPGNTFYFQLFALDSGLQASTAATDSVTVALKSGDHTSIRPSTPVATSRLGTITVTWDGKLANGSSAPSDIVVMNIYVSTTSGFTPGPTNLALKTRVFGSDGGFDVLTDLLYNTSYYIRISLVDTSGVEGLYSDPQVTAQVSPLVDTDLIYSTLSEWPFNGGVVPAGALASGAINASNLFGANVIVQSAIAANAIGADQIAAGSIIAGKIGADAVTATTIAAGAITAGKIDTNAVTADKILAGAITAIKIDSNAITADKIDAGAITATKLATDIVLSGLIRTATSGARIEIRGATQANPGIVSYNGSGGTSFRFYANGVSYLDDVFIDNATLSGTLTVSGSVSGGSFVGGTFRTASGTGQRVIISGTTNRAAFYNTGDADASPTGYIQGTGSGLFINAASSGSLAVGGTAIFSWNSTGVALSPGERFNSAIDATGAISSDTSVQAGTFIRSGNGTGSTLNTNGNITVAAFTTSALAANVRGANGAVLALFSSDARIKRNIETITSGLEVVSRINPVTFDSIVDDTDKRIPGFIAQELEEIFDENLAIVTKIAPGSTDIPFDIGDDPLRSVEHIHLMPYLVKAIQELSEKNNELQAKITALEER